jgi:glycosyltransferase involved in cell wall biosynthesis
LLDMADAERRLLIEALRLAARIVVHTVEDLNRLREFGLVANTVMIPQGAVERPQAAAGQASVRPTVIGCYGFFLPEKGISQLIEAVARLGAERDIRLRLVNADYGTPDSAGEIARCRALAGAAGLDQRIDWQTEFQSDEDSLRMLGECDLIVLPYQQSKEGSSAALRMALSSGVPVAVTPLPLFDEAENAIYRFAGTEPADLASGIAHLLDRPEALQALREAAQLWLAPRRWPLIATRFGGMLRGLHVNANRP